MSKKSKFEQIEPDEDGLALLQRREWKNLGEIDQEIKKLENNVPDKRTIQYSEWLKKVNFLCHLYNETAYFKAYKKYE